MAFPCRLKKLAGAMLEVGLVKVVPNLALKGKWYFESIISQLPFQDAFECGHQSIRLGPTSTALKTKSVLSEDRQAQPHSMEQI